MIATQRNRRKQLGCVGQALILVGIFAALAFALRQLGDVFSPQQRPEAVAAAVEIAKCIVLCWPCHMHYHMELRRLWSKENKHMIEADMAAVMVNLEAAFG